MGHPGQPIYPMGRPTGPVFGDPTLMGRPGINSLKNYKMKKIKH
jgi:hypothetical protein